MLVPFFVLIGGLLACAATCAGAAFACFDCRAVKADPIAAGWVIVGEEVGGADGLHFFTCARQG